MRFSVINLLLLSIVSALSGQEFKDGILDSNAIRTVFNNRGSIGDVLTGGLEWPQGEMSLPYMIEMGLVVGGEVVDANGQTIHIVSDGMFHASGGEYQPGSTNPWGWLPLTGYDNPDSFTVALSDDPATWPAHWTSWPGKLGDGILRADLETYWAATDSSNAEFAYFPLSSDSTVRGTGAEGRRPCLPMDAPQI